MSSFIKPIPRLSIRTSPIRSNIAQRTVYHYPAPSREPSTMFGKFSKPVPPTKPPMRNDLSKTLFPSSSPNNGDIRDLWKKTSSASVADASVEKNDASKSENSQIPMRGGTNQGSLSSLYKTSDSFTTESTPTIDLTSATSSFNEKPRDYEPVYFGPDDISDDDPLDIDFKIPSAMPASTVVEQPSSQSIPAATQHVPWSSSPATHWEAPKPVDLRTSTTKTSDPVQKRESSSDNTPLDAPPAKKAKKRGALPWSGAENAIVIDDLPPTKTPNPKFSSGFWDPSASAVKEQKQKLKNQRKPELDDEPQNDLLQAPSEDHKPSKQPISLSAEQRRVLDLVVNHNKSVFFTGPAGTGKSVLMRAIIEELKKKHVRTPERVAVTASTGLAACNIGGITLHSYSGIGLGKEPAAALVKKIRRNPKAKTRWLQTKCLIIDEVSMVDGDLFDKLSQVGRTLRNNGRPWGGIQLIVTGDFFQLPPVPDFGNEKRDIKFAFEASTWNTSIDHTIGLTTVFRQRDPQFANMLNEMRLGVITDATEKAFKALARPLKFDDGIEMAELYPTRAQVENSNNMRLKALPGKAMEFSSADFGDVNVRDKLLSNMMAPKSIQLKIDAQVMLIKNLDENLVNGSLGKVIDFVDEQTFEQTDGFDGSMDDPFSKAKKKLAGSGVKYPVVRFTATNGGTRVILCQPEEWKVELPNGEVQAKRTQLPLILAWALSIHKAQGQTLERVTVNLGKIFEKGQAYVALSRATSQHGLQVLNFNKHKVQAHPRVCAFYKQLYSVDSVVTSRPSSIAEFIESRKGFTRTAQVLNDD